MKGSASSRTNLENTDEDQADRDFSIFPKRDLFECVDADKNPLVYLDSKGVRRAQVTS